MGALTRAITKERLRLPVLLVAVAAATFFIYWNTRQPGQLPNGIIDFLIRSLLLVALYLIAAALVLRWQSDSENHIALAIVIVAAIAFRGVLVSSTPYLSDDVYRYLWDGRVQTAGINPYLYVPASPELAHLRDERVYPFINRKDYAVTIYPPAAQLLFHGMQRVGISSLKGLKIAFVAADALSIVLLMAILARLGRPMLWATLYAWHPVAVWEIGLAGHLDAVVIPLMLAAIWLRMRGRDVVAGLTIGIAVATKFYPAILLAALHRRSRWRLEGAALLAIACLYVPFLQAGGRVLGFLMPYVTEEGWVSGARYFLLNLVQTLVPLRSWIYVALAAVVTLIMIRRQTAERRRRESVEGAADEASQWLRHARDLAGLVLVLASPRHAWYYLWLIPLTVLSPSPGWWLLTLTSIFFYLNWLVADEPGRILLIQLLVFGPPLLVAVLRRTGFRPRNIASGGPDPH